MVLRRGRCSHLTLAALRSGSATELGERADKGSGLDAFVTELSQVQIQPGTEFHGRTHAGPSRGSVGIPRKATAQSQKKQGLIVTENLFHGRSIFQSAIRVSSADQSGNLSTSWLFIGRRTAMTDATLFVKLSRATQAVAMKNSGERLSRRSFVDPDDCSTS
jgi:hypothetical protein